MKQVLIIRLIIPMDTATNPRDFTPPS